MANVFAEMLAGPLLSSLSDFHSLLRFTMGFSGLLLGFCIDVSKHRDLRIVEVSSGRSPGLMGGCCGHQRSLRVLVPPACWGGTICRGSIRVCWLELVRLADSNSIQAKALEEYGYRLCCHPSFIPVSSLDLGGVWGLVVSKCCVAESDVYEERPPFRQQFFSQNAALYKARGWSEARLALSGPLLSPCHPMQEGSDFIATGHFEDCLLLLSFSLDVLTSPKGNGDRDIPFGLGWRT